MRAWESGGVPSLTHRDDLRGYPNGSPVAEALRAMYTPEEVELNYLEEQYAVARLVRKFFCPPGFSALALTNTARQYPSDRTGPTGRYRPRIPIVPFERKPLMHV